MKKTVFFLFVIGAIFVPLYFWLVPKIPKNRPIIIYSQPARNSWEVQSVDTMKYSRDVAAEKLYNTSFDAEIERQVRAIAKTGATHVAIGTPYDEKFFPYLQRWVDMARQYNLNVWFRGNWSGWEGWFDFQKNITRAEHIQKTQDFILKHPNIFSDGDIFSACPECENGGPGDPRLNGDVSGHRKFLLDEYVTAKNAFKTIGKNVKANYFSMNGDVARLVMNKETTQALDGIVVVDHYVATPEKLAKDIQNIANTSGGRVVLGEWGVAIPDIHGAMSEEARAQWVEKALAAMRPLGKELAGMNYWLAVGGSTELWHQGNETSKVSEVLQKYYKTQVIYGNVADELNQPIKGAKVSLGSESALSDEEGYFEWRGLEKVQPIHIMADGYIAKDIPVTDSFQNVVLVKENPDFAFKIFLWLKKIR
ncbi:MAG: CS1-pili formation C-terminal domain-containing protein [Patescibacteria group bacterium]